MSWIRRIFGRKKKVKLEVVSHRTRRWSADSYSEPFNPQIIDNPHNYSDDSPQREDHTIQFGGGSFGGGGSSSSWGDSSSSDSSSYDSSSSDSGSSDSSSSD